MSFYYNTQYVHTHTFYLLYLHLQNINRDFDIIMKENNATL